MTILSRLPSLTALAAVVLAVLAGPAAAHGNTFRLQNCTGDSYYAFNVFNKGDNLQLVPTANSSVENGTSKVFWCSSDKYCWVNYKNTNAPVFRVANEITFYTRTRIVHFIDAHCAGK